MIFFVFSYKGAILVRVPKDNVHIEKLIVAARAYYTAVIGPYFMHELLVESLDPSATSVKS